MAISAVDAGVGLRTVSLEEWNFDQRVIAPFGLDDDPNTVGLSSNKFASAKALMIAAGPSSVTGINGVNVTPIGLVQDFNLQQERALSEIYEIGSRGTYYMTGRETRRLSLSSIVYSGNSLLRALTQQTSGEFPTGNGERFEALPGASEGELFYSNLASRFFENPTGLYIRIESLSDALETDRELTNSGQIGGMYLEECYIRAHGLTSNANNTVVAENAVITFSRVIPMPTDGTDTSRLSPVIG